MIVRTEEIGDKRKTLLGDLIIKDMSLIMNPGGPFIRYLLEDMLGALVNQMRQNVAEDYDNVIIVEGDEGSGKSNLAYEICRRFDSEFNINENLIYSLDELEKRLQKGDDKRQIFWLDEYYDIGSKRDWNSQENKRFNSLLVKMRSRGWSLVMCIPLADDSDSYVREHRARYLLTCAPCEFEHTPYRERGFFECLVRKKASRYHKKKSGDTIRDKFQHIGYGEYSKMPAEVNDVYSKCKDASQERAIMSNDGEAPGAKYRAKYENQSKRLSRAILMLYNAGVPKDEIMAELGIKSENTYYGFLKRGKNAEFDAED